MTVIVCQLHRGEKNTHRDSVIHGKSNFAGRLSWVFGEDGKEVVGGGGRGP